MKKRISILLIISIFLALFAFSNGKLNVNAAQKVTKLVLAFPTWTGAPKDLLKVQEAMNKISRQKIGVEVKFLVTDFASYQNQITLMLTGNEQLDIFVTLGNLYVPSVQKGQLLNLEEGKLLQNYGKDIIKAVGWEYINACRIGGILYGLPNNRDLAVGKGCVSVRTDLLKEIGYKYKNTGETERITIDELNSILEKIHKKHPELEIIRPVTNSMVQFSPIDPIGGNVFGVLMDYGSSLKVTNLFTTKYYFDYCSRMNSYFKKGYISKDASSDNTPVGELVKAGTLAAYITGGKPGIKAQETNLCGRDMTILQTMDDFTSSSHVSAFPWVISYNCKSKVAAMKYLNLLYSDSKMMNLITWGIEGVHYIVKKDGFITFPKGVNAMNSGYLHTMNWMFPNQFITKIWEGNDPKLWEKMKSFNSKAKKSKALGFTFDSSNVATELAAVQNVYDEYQKSLEFGMKDPKVGIPELNKKIKAAGLDKIIAEKQSQLNKWISQSKK